MKINSYDAVYDRYTNTGQPASYPTEFSPKKRRQIRERNNAQTAIGHLEPGMQVLDIPCGSGRLARLLLDAGMRVTAADRSLPMLEQAQANLTPAYRNSHKVEFRQIDALDTGYENNHFDAVLCYRLLHHFHEPELRIKTLQELARISRGPVITSIFTSNALDYYAMLLKQWLRPTKPMHRSYIPLELFEAEAAQAKLTVVQAIPQWRWVSPVWLYVLNPRS